VPVAGSTLLSPKLIVPRCRVAVFVDEPHLVGEGHVDLNLGLAGRLDFPLADQPAEHEQRPLVDIEEGIDRVHRDDRRENGVVGFDEVAGVDVPAADLAADRGR
jgi:hypothetical protein